MWRRTHVRKLPAKTCPKRRRRQPAIQLRPSACSACLQRRRSQVARGRRHARGAACAAAAPPARLPQPSGGGGERRWRCPPGGADGLCRTERVRRRRARHQRQWHQWHQCHRHVGCTSKGGGAGRHLTLSRTRNFSGLNAFENSRASASGHFSGSGALQPPPARRPARTASAGACFLPAAERAQRAAPVRRSRRHRLAGPLLSRKCMKDSSQNGLAPRSSQRAPIYSALLMPSRPWRSGGRG